MARGALRLASRCCILTLCLSSAAGIYISRVFNSKEDAAPSQHAPWPALEQREAAPPAGGDAGAVVRGDAAGAPTQQQGLRFLRIQKTGGSIFGDVIVKKFCGSPVKGCQGVAHDDWSQVTQNGTYHGAVVTLLRDPVERTLSEFFWLRTPEGLASASHPDWDFRNDTWLQIVQKHPDVDHALDVYLHGYDKSPSRNRQTLYLLGFRDGIEGDKGYEAANPGASYEWDVTWGKHVRRAMENLDRMTAYGIADCWMPSMRAIARKLGWDVKEVEEFAAASTPEYGKHEINLNALMLDRSPIATSTSFRRTVSKDKIKDIEAVNKVDLLLFRRALKRFVERFGEACTLPYEPFGPALHEFKKSKHSEDPE